MLDSFTFSNHSDEFSFFYEQYIDYLNFLNENEEISSQVEIQKILLKGTGFILMNPKYGSIVEVVKTSSFHGEDSEFEPPQSHHGICENLFVIYFSSTLQKNI